MSDLFISVSALFLGAFLGWCAGEASLGIGLAAFLLVGFYCFQLSYIARVSKSGPVSKQAVKWWMSPSAKRLLSVVIDAYSSQEILSKAVDRYRLRSRRRKIALNGVILELRKVMEAFPDPILILDSEKRLIQWNRSASRLFSFSHALDRKQPIRSLIDDGAFLSLLDIEVGENVELSSIGMEHESFFARRSLLTEDRTLIQLQNITRLRELEVVRQNFVANASHELRTPLTVVHGYLETLIDHSLEAGDSDFQTLFQKMHFQTSRMKRIIEDMLLLSRLDSDYDPIEEEIDICEFLNNISDEIKAVAATKNHSIQLKLDNNYVLRANREALFSVVSNLVSNAVRYMDDSGEIVINGWANSDGGYLSFNDKGIGIEKRHIEKISERFYRVDVVRSRESGGTGLGLAIVRHALAGMEGDLSITSLVGEGSTFTLRFPLSRVCIQPVGPSMP